jgi:hypothetical protein
MNVTEQLRLATLSAAGDEATTVDSSPGTGEETTRKRKRKQMDGNGDDDDGAKAAKEKGAQEGGVGGVPKLTVQVTRLLAEVWSTQLSIQVPAYTLSTY